MPSGRQISGSPGCALGARAGRLEDHRAAGRGEGDLGGLVEAPHLHAVLQHGDAVRSGGDDRGRGSRPVSSVASADAPTVRRRCVGPSVGRRSPRAVTASGRRARRSGGRSPNGPYGEHARRRRRGRRRRPDRRRRRQRASRARRPRRRWSMSTRSVPSTQPSRGAGVVDAEPGRAARRSRRRTSTSRRGRARPRSSGGELRRRPASRASPRRRGCTTTRWTTCRRRARCSPGASRSRPHS